MAVTGADAEGVFIRRHSIKCAAVPIVHLVFTGEKVSTLDVATLEIGRRAVESIDPGADVFTHHAEWAVYEGGFGSNDVLNIGRHIFRVGVDRIQNARRAAAD